MLEHREEKKCEFILMAAPSVTIISECEPGFLLSFFIKSHIYNRFMFLHLQCIGFSLYFHVCVCITVYKYVCKKKTKVSLQELCTLTRGILYLLTLPSCDSSEFKGNPFPDGLAVKSLCL